MKALIRTAETAEALEWMEWPDPRPGPGQVVVRIERAAICSTDVAIWAGTYRGRQPTTIPAMVGHEAAGVVEQVAGDVDGVSVGDRVALQVIWGHPQSWETLNGRENLDSDWYHLGTATHPGAFAERIATAAEHVIRLPDEIDWDDGALLEAFSIAANALELTGLALGETFAAVGPGTFGLMTAQIALAVGASHVAVVGLAAVDERRLEVARSLGVHTCLSYDGDAGASAAAFAAAAGGRGADVVVDNGGTAESMPLAFELAAPSARVAVTGFSPSAEIEPFRHIVRKALTVRGVAASQRRHYGPALRMMLAGIRPSEIVSHRLPFEQATEGMRLMHAREATKVLLVP